MTHFPVIVLTFCSWSRQTEIRKNGW